MGLISGMAGFLGLSGLGESQKEQIRDEIDLFDAVSAHVKWKVRLQNYLEGKSEEKLDPMVVCRDDQCSLGKWIHGPAIAHFYEDATFHQLRADHAQFHYVAGNVVQHVHANDRHAAHALFEGEYKQISHKVVHALTELNQHING